MRHHNTRSRTTAVGCASVRNDTPTGESGTGHAIDATPRTPQYPDVSRGDSARGEARELQPPVTAEARTPEAQGNPIGAEVTGGAGGFAEIDELFTASPSMGRCPR